MSIIIKKVINFCYYRPIASLGLFILIFFTFVGIFAPLIAPYGPIEMIVKDRLSPPSLKHWRGTDHLGMDIFSRVVYSTRIDLFIAVTSVSLAIVIGVPLGALIGYAPKKVDEIVMRLIDGINAFPMFILALIVAAAIGPGLKNVIFVVAFVNFPSYLRLVRGQVLSIKEMQFMRTEGIKLQDISDKLTNKHRKKFVVSFVHKILKREGEQIQLRVWTQLFYLLTIGIRRNRFIVKL